MTSENAAVAAATDRTERGTTLLVEYSCRHRDIVTRPLYSEWRGTYEPCAVCEQVMRKIVWVDDDY